MTSRPNAARWSHSLVRSPVAPTDCVRHSNLSRSPAASPCTPLFLHPHPALALGATHRYQAALPDPTPAGAAPAYQTANRHRSPRPHAPRLLSPFFFFLIIRPPPRSPLFPYTTLSR